MTLLVTEYMVFGEVSQVTCTKGLQEGCCCVFRVVVVVLVSLATRRVFCLRWGLRQRIERVSTRVLISLGATTAVEDVDGSIAKVERGRSERQHCTIYKFKSRQILLELVISS